MLSPLIKSYSELESLHKMDSYRESFSTQLHLETILLKKHVKHVSLSLKKFQVCRNCNLALSYSSNIITNYL